MFRACHALFVIHIDIADECLTHFTQEATTDCQLIQTTSLIQPSQVIDCKFVIVKDTYQCKYCWFGRWLGVWSTPSHTLRNFVIYTFSCYKYTLISEWSRLFGLLRILDNLISGAVGFFCTTISVFREIYTLRMRVVDHAAIVWVGCFLCRRPELGLYLSPSVMAYFLERLN